MLRHLVGKGLFEEQTPGRFALNEVARGLLDDQNRLGLDLEGFGGRMAHVWGTLLSAVRTGRPAYDEAFGHRFWEDLEAHQDIAASFDALRGPAGHGVPDPQILVDPAHWESLRTVVDVGGGTGALLAEVLRSRPEIRGTLVELPRTAASSDAVFKAAGVADRVTTVGQSFFDPLPGGGDLYVLKSILADWPDREATAILQRCAEAARPSGRVVDPDILFSNLTNWGARKLVLSSRRPGFPEAQALAAIRDFMAEHGKRPTADSWTAAGMRPSQTTIRNRFGSFREAIEAALDG